MAAKILGSAALSATTWTAVYTVPTSYEAVANINVCNRGTSQAKVRIAIGPSGTPTNAEIFEYDAVLGAAGLNTNVLERTGVPLAAGDKVMVYADTANVSVQVTGYEDAV